MRLSGAAMMKRAAGAIVVIVLVVSLPPGSRAQTGDLRTEMMHCLTFSGAVERLSCYDRLARGASSGTLPAPALQTPQMAVPRAPIPQSRTEPVAGPQNLGREELRTNPPPAPGEDRLSATISDFRRDPTGRFTVVLNNGQIWQQIAGDTGIAQYRPGKPQTVTISKGSLGSYDLRFEGRNVSFKVRRLK
jgi:hypothetical protein